MALQEMDLTIKHRSGKHNANADALSRFPHTSPADSDADVSSGVVASVTGEEVEDLATLQRQDEELRAIITYVETGVLPDDMKIAKKLALTQSQFVVEEGVLYWIAGDLMLRVIPPRSMRERLFQEAHSGRFGAHVGHRKMHSQFLKHHWLSSMRADITRWCRACLVCATYLCPQSQSLDLLTVLTSTLFSSPQVQCWQPVRTRIYGLLDEVARSLCHTRPVRSYDRTAVSRAHGKPAWGPCRSPLRPRSVISIITHERGGGPTRFHKVNTSAYHPQTDGLVERYNRTLTAMLAITVQNGGRDWDERIPYVLFA